MSLSIRCGLTIGPARSAGSGGGVTPPGVDLSDIDLTATTLDSRLKFSCASSRAYYAADGTIQFAEPDVWPVEYRDGVAVGRHEPEAQATNLKIGSRAPSATLYQLTKTGNEVLSPAGIDELIEFVTAYTTGTPTLFSDVTLSESGPLTVSVIGRNGAAEMTIRKESTTDSVGFMGDFGRSVLVSNYDATATRNRYSVYFPRTVGDTGYVWHIQLETGGIATSPIITTDSAVTRAAAFASVTNPGRAASGIQIWYTDGDVLNLDFNGANSVDIPLSHRDWGTRYISRITYVKTPIDPLRDIDLLSETLDSRVTYKRAGNLSYWSKDGTLQQAPADVWPLEYRDGVAVGRHEPEPQATNYVPHGANVQPSSVTGAPVIESGPVVQGIQLYNVTMDTSAGGDRFLQFDTQFAGAGVQITSSLYVMTGGTHPAGTAANRVLVYGNVAPYLDRRSILTFASGEAVPYPSQAEYIDDVIATERHGLYRFSMTVSTQAGATKIAPRVMLLPATPGGDASGLIGIIQVEQGAFATSPILTTTGAATRPKPIASVVNPGGKADLLRVFYSGDNSRDFEFPPDGSPLEIPEAELSWGTRYILRMRYIVED